MDANFEPPSPASGDTSSLPPHAADAIRAIENLHLAHRARATTLDRRLDRLKAALSHPWFVVGMTLFILFWILLGFVLRGSRWAWDAPPFPWLQIVVCVFDFYVALLILATQRRADSLAEHREQLILLSSLASEQKTAKIIALLEELRRDSPEVRDRVDREAEDMGAGIDPRAASDALLSADSAAGDTKP
jgi:uncharacterized membrane protein